MSHRCRLEKGYWCQSLSPVFFGRSVCARHRTKAESRIRREKPVKQFQQNGREAQVTADAARVAEPGLQDTIEGDDTTGETGKESRVITLARDERDKCDPRTRRPLD